MGRIAPSGGSTWNSPGRPSARLAAAQPPASTTSAPSAAPAARSAPRRPAPPRCSRATPTARTSSAAGIRTSVVALISVPAPIAAKNATPPPSVSPRRRMRAPSHSASAQAANIAASGLSEPARKVVMGTRPVTAAAASCRSRRGPKTSPASSQAPRDGDEQPRDGQRPDRVEAVEHASRGGQGVGEDRVGVVQGRVGGGGAHPASVAPRGRRQHRVVTPPAGVRSLAPLDPRAQRARSGLGSRAVQGQALLGGALGAVGVAGQGEPVADRLDVGEVVVLVRALPRRHDEGPRQREEQDRRQQPQQRPRKAALTHGDEHYSRAPWPSSSTAATGRTWPASIPTGRWCRTPRSASEAGMPTSC